VKILFQILFFLCFSLSKSQELRKLINIPDNIENKREIRIYRGNVITNSGKVFRIYLNENKFWNAELIQWYFPKKVSDDEFEVIPPVVTKLKSEVSLEQIFFNLEALNIGFLPKEELFQYKKSKKEVVFDEDEKDYVLVVNKINALDGNDFLVKYKSDKKENEFHYYNPKTYLDNFPGIDEYESFMKILKYVEDNFNIKLN
jgi:hypothetical protein